MIMWCYLCLHHVVPLSSHGEDVVEYVDGALLLNHLHHGLDGDQSARAAHTSTGRGRERESKEGERESEKERGEGWRGRVEGKVEWYTCDCHVIEESHVIFT